MNIPLSTTWGVIMDNNLVTRQHTEGLNLGLFRRIPLMLTATTEESRFFIPTDFFVTSAQVEIFKSRLFPFMTREELLKLDIIYPDSTGILGHGLVNAMSEFYFICPARKLAKTFSSLGIPVYKALFSTFNVSLIADHSLGLLNNPFGSTRTPVSHGLDIPFWWSNTIVMGFFGQEKTLARYMSSS